MRHATRRFAEFAARVQQLEQRSFDAVCGSFDAADISRQAVVPRDMLPLGLENYARRLQGWPRIAAAGCFRPLRQRRRLRVWGFSTDVAWATAVGRPADKEIYRRAGALFPLTRHTRQPSYRLDTAIGVYMAALRHGSAAAAGLSSLRVVRPGPAATSAGVRIVEEACSALRRYHRVSRGAWRLIIQAVHWPEMLAIDTVTRPMEVCVLDALRLPPRMS